MEQLSSSACSDNLETITHYSQTCYVFTDWLIKYSIYFKLTEAERGNSPESQNASVHKLTLAGFFVLKSTTTRMNLITKDVNIV